MGPVPEGQWPTGLMLGDVIQYNEEDDAAWEHAAIVVRFDTNCGRPLVASHSPNIAEVDFMSVVQHVKTRFIHIERSDGYPPVNTRITQGSDDAGINPTGCVFSATNNEVYLGTCSSGGNITSGFRFNNIQVPKNATIKYALVTFTVDGTYTNPINVEIYGEDAANSATFTSGSPPSSRSTPYPPALWNISDTWSLSLRRTTPQLSSVIEKIVERGDWAPGNSLSIIIKNAAGSTAHRRVIAIERFGFSPNLSPARFIAAYDIATSSFSYNSLGSQDGWILESTETSDIGGSRNSGSSSFRLGDDVANKQYRSTLHFDTSNLPDTAVITSVILKIKQQGSVTGTDPFTTHGGLLIDIQKPYFGTAASLANADFQATAGQSTIATFDPVPASGWYTALLSSSAFPHINLAGTTQFRLYFTLDDNNDLGADYMAFSSGNNVTVANRPQLIINYYIP